MFTKRIRLFITALFIKTPNRRQPECLSIVEQIRNLWSIPRWSINSNLLWFSRLQLFCNSMEYSLPGSLPMEFSKNIGVGCHFLLQGIFLTQELNPHLLDWQAGSLPLSHQGSPLTAIRINKLSRAVTDGPKRVHSICFYFEPVQNQAKL